MENVNMNGTNNVSAEEISELIELRRKKKRYAVVVRVLVGFVILLLILMAYMGTRLVRASAQEISYEPVKTETDKFYPGRAQGDYSDICFEVNSYLNSIGATEIQRAIYQTNDGTHQKLLFSLGNFDWTVETVVFADGNSNYGVYTGVEAKNRISGTIYRAPVENCGTLMMDATSPFWFDRLAFDMFHIATDPNSELKAELREHMTERDCPFYGLGILHYDKDPKTGEVRWHDDLGGYTVEEGLDLHY
ncbi:hypothetical protein IJF91_01830 [Candidatus Saccharibacteria bacterium]|nr:hypothetical protein [Candidatus Saccharibacteria bacterium]